MLAVIPVVEELLLFLSLTLIPFIQIRGVFMNNLKNTDPEIFAAIQAEVERQNEGLELIASENFVSDAVMEAVGSVMTKKYAEGYPAKRYYGGCVHVDKAEQLATDRLKELFGCDHANVQPHSGTSANIAAYMASIKPGDTVMGMDLNHGGHLSHGHPLNYSGINYNIVAYGVDKETELLDYDNMRKIALECKPAMIMIGASAYSRFIDYEAIKKIADEVGAVTVADIAHVAGLIAAGIHPNPVPHCDFVTSTTHKTLRGPRGGIVMCKEKWAEALDKIVFPGIQGGPLMHAIAGKAVAFKEALNEDFVTYQKQVVANAAVMAETLKARDFKLVSDGTDNHLVLVNSLASRGVSGKKGEARLEGAGITTNKNTVPFDTKKPWVSSGIRLGSPACTSRGMKEEEFKIIGNLVADVLDATKENVKEVKAATFEKVKALTAKFPLYPHLVD
jgi:glycine hydroxymethyltransferase